MKGEMKFYIAIVCITFAIVGGAMYLGTRPQKTVSDSDILPPTTQQIGNPSAQIVLVEFSDFQCPACKAYAPVVNELLKKYDGKILFGYRHFPLPQHTNALSAAIASEAAGKQGKFWEMSEYLFNHQNELSDETIRKGAETFELDMEKFTDDLKDKNILDKIEADKNDAVRFGVNSTPTFFLNGKKLETKKPQDLITEIEKALQ